MSQSQEDQGWLDTLSEILTAPLPGTGQQAEDIPPPPVIHAEDEDDASLLDTITDILTQPLPGTEAKTESETTDEGEAAINEASECAEDDDDPAATTGMAGADWMQREYERFNRHQEQARQAFTDRQRYEHERFFEYQKRQLEAFSRSQMREQDVFRHHQQARFHAWRSELQHQFAAHQGRPSRGPRMRPPPPPPPWWRNQG